MHGKAAWGFGSALPKAPPVPRLAFPEKGQVGVVAAAAAAANSSGDDGDPWVHTPPQRQAPSGDPWTADLRPAAGPWGKGPAKGEKSSLENAPWRGTASWKSEGKPGKAKGDGGRGNGKTSGNAKAKGGKKGSGQDRGDGYVDGRGYVDVRNSTASNSTQPHSYSGPEWHDRSTAARSSKGKGQWPQSQQEKLPWVAGSHTRHDPDAWRYKSYCLNENPTAATDRNGTPNKYYVLDVGCTAWAFRDRRLKECKGCSHPIDYSWEAFYQGKTRWDAWKKSIGEGSDDEQGWGQWHSWMQSNHQSQSWAAAPNYDVEKNWNQDARVGGALACIGERCAHDPRALQLAQSFEQGLAALDISAPPKRIARELSAEEAVEESAADLRCFSGKLKDAERGAINATAGVTAAKKVLTERFQAEMAKKESVEKLRDGFKSAYHKHFALVDKLKAEGLFAGDGGCISAPSSVDSSDHGSDSDPEILVLRKRQACELAAAKEVSRVKRQALTAAHHHDTPFGGFHLVPGQGGVHIVRKDCDDMARAAGLKPDIDGDATMAAAVDTTAAAEGCTAAASACAWTAAAAAEAAAAAGTLHGGFADIGPNYNGEFPALPGQHAVDLDLAPAAAPQSPAEDKVAQAAIDECLLNAKGKGSVRSAPYGESPPSSSGKGKGEGGSATEEDIPADSGRELGDAVPGI
jgi:hypothetical protein